MPLLFTLRITSIQTQIIAPSALTITAVGGEGTDVRAMSTLGHALALSNNPRRCYNGFMNCEQARVWTVVKEAIPKEKALGYTGKAYDWLEGWNLGFNHNDPSARKASKLPFTHRAGIFARYGIAHEQWVWDIKSEPRLVGKFA